jgi:hypothetical protein
VHISKFRFGFDFVISYHHPLLDKRSLSIL